MTKLTLTNLANLENQTTVVTSINNNNTSIVNAVENTLSRDGTSPNTMLSELDMNSNRIINLPAPLADQEPVRLYEWKEIVTPVVNGAIPDNTITNAKLSSMAAGTVKANITGVTAQASDVTLSALGTALNPYISSGTTSPANTLRGNLTGSSAPTTDVTVAA